MKRILIQGGRVIDPVQNIDRPMTVLVEGGRIAALVSPQSRKVRSSPGDQLVDASGRWVVPGLIDVHVHLRQPGMTRAENVSSGTRAAAAGGFTCVVCMPNTKPSLDRPEVLRRLLKVIQKQALVRVVPAAALSRDLAGRELSDIPALCAAGAGALSDDGLGTGRGRVMEAALVASRAADMAVLVHAEDKRLSAGGVMRTGAVARRLGLAGISSESETARVKRDLGILSRVGGRVHFQHLSTLGALGAVRRAKAAGLAATCEATPHHLFLCDEDVEKSCTQSGPDPNFKMNPPLGRPAEREALRQALVDGTIDAIASDHAPHLASAKALGFRAAPFGIVGLETTLPLTLRLVEQGLLTRSRAISLLTAQPAAVVGLAAGDLLPGRRADLTIIDPRQDWQVLPKNFESRSRNTPFAGWPMRGRAVATMVGGRMVFNIKRKKR